MHLQCLSKNKRQNANIKRSSFAERGIYQKIFVYIKRVAGCKIEAQCKSAVGADSILSLTIAAGKEARLARGGIREHEAFLNREKQDTPPKWQKNDLVSGWWAFATIFSL